MTTPLLPSLSCITLDAAGTLFRLKAPVGQVYAEIGTRHGLSLDAASVDTAFRAAWKALPPPLQLDGPATDDDRSWWRAIVALTLQGSGAPVVPETTVDAFFAELYDHFADSTVWELYSDTLPALELLRPHFRLMVLSNFDKRLLSILEGLGILPYFEQVIISSQVGAYKPHPRIFAHALAAIGLPAARCLHIGDDRRCDFEGAQAAGMGAILLSRPDGNLMAAAKKILTDGNSCLHHAFS